MRRELLDGTRTIIPLVLAALPIGFVFGTVAAGNGLSPLETVLMSALVFAGGSQFVAMDLWTHPASWSALGLAALLSTWRHILQRASLERSSSSGPGLAELPTLLAVMADENGAGRSARPSKAADTGLLSRFGAALLLRLGAGESLGGALFGTLLGDVTVYGLDFAFPAVFIKVPDGLWRRKPVLSGLGVCVARPR